MAFPNPFSGSDVTGLAGGLLDWVKNQNQQNAQGGGSIANVGQPGYNDVGQPQPAQPTPIGQPAAVATQPVNRQHVMDFLSWAANLPKTAGSGATTDQASQFVSPLAMQAYFAKTIGPMLEQIGKRQDQAITDFVSKAGAGNVDQTQLASMKNVNNALAGAAVAAPGLDMLMNQVNAALNAQQKAYFAAQSGATAGGGDLMTQLASLLGSGG